MRQPEVKEAVLRGAVPLQLYRVVADHALEPRATIRHMQLTAVKRADAQLQHRVQVYTQQALVVVPTLPATAPTLHGSAAAQNARRRPRTPDAADSDPAKRLERRCGGGQPRRRVVGRPHRRGPSDTPPPPPLARTNVGAARPGRGPHGLRPRPRGLQRCATGQSAPHWQPAQQLGLRQPHEPKQLPQHRRHPHHPPPDRLRLAGGGRGTGDGYRPRCPWRQLGDFLHRGGAMTPRATERLMAAYLTWRGIPPPRSLESLMQRTLQPHVPPPQPGTYGNAAVARMMARGTRLDSSSYSPRRTTATITTPPPRYRATTATRATNVRARTSAATSSTSPHPSTSAPPKPAAESHQQHAADATQTTGGPSPSRAGTPQSP